MTCKLFDVSLWSIVLAFAFSNDCLIDCSFIQLSIIRSIDWLIAMALEQKTSKSRISHAEFHPSKPTCKSASRRTHLTTSIQYWKLENARATFPLETVFAAGSKLDEATTGSMEIHLKFNCISVVMLLTCYGSIGKKGSISLSLTKPARILPNIRFIRRADEGTKCGGAVHFSQIFHSDSSAPLPCLNKKTISRPCNKTQINKKNNQFHQAVKNLINQSINRLRKKPRVYESPVWRHG